MGGIILRVIYLLLLPMTLLIGCSFSEEELLEHMVTRSDYEDGCYNVYIVFENEETALDGTFDGELSEISKRKTSMYGPLHTWDWSKWNYTKVFNITEYPTFLVVDNEELVLQTVNFQEVDTFLSNQTERCMLWENE